MPRRQATTYGMIFVRKATIYAKTALEKRVNEVTIEKLIHSSDIVLK
jgi:hypothetical protein